MPQTVKYEASEGQGAVTVQGVRFRPGQEREVDDALAEELLTMEHYRFERVGGVSQPESTTDPDT